MKLVNDTDQHKFGVFFLKAAKASEVRQCDPNITRYSVKVLVKSFVQFSLCG